VRINETGQTIEASSRSLDFVPGNIADRSLKRKYADHDIGRQLQPRIGDVLDADVAGPEHHGGLARFLLLLPSLAPVAPRAVA
jgi:hypothetical protein